MNISSYSISWNAIPPGNTAFQQWCAAFSYLPTKTKGNLLLSMQGFTSPGKGAKLQTFFAIEKNHSSFKLFIYIT